MYATTTFQNITYKTKHNKLHNPKLNLPILNFEDGHQMVNIKFPLLDQVFWTNL
jgi:hypothetical protein